MLNMADITNVFKATVKTIRVREKSLGTVSGIDKNILPPCRKPKTEFTTNAVEVISNIGKLRDFLLQHRKDYLSTTSHVGGEPSKMTDMERDQIDADAELYIKTCVSAIQQLRSQAHSNKEMRQVKEHKDAVLDLIDRYLTGVCKLYSEQRAIRVKRVVDRKRIGRLEPVSPSSVLGEADVCKTQQADVTTDEVTPTTSAAGDSDVRHIPVSSALSSTAAAAAAAADDTQQPHPLSDEDQQMLQLENEQLYDELNSMVDEVRQIEGKIVEISRLQEIFADKVLQQDRDINKVSETVVGTTENIKDGNDEIREAMKNNAVFRIWILFFLIVCTFSLLFLDWYNA